MLEIPFYMVDAFSDRAFGGNPAAVCPLVDWLPDATLLKMAQSIISRKRRSLSAPTAASNCAGLPPVGKSTSADTPRSPAPTSF